VLVIAAGLAVAAAPHAAPQSLDSSVAASSRQADQPPGYALVGTDGGVFTFGSASSAGSMAGHHLTAPISAITESVDGTGYWLAANDKGVFTLGDSGFHGSGADVTFPCFGPPPGAACSEPAIGAIDPSPAVGIARSLNGDGYLVAMADGAVYGYGDVPWDDGRGFVPKPLAAPIVGVAMSADDAGYWLAGADGGVFSIGLAPFYGSLGGTRLTAPITGVAADPDGGGYWLVGADGGVFSFGDAPFEGSLPGLGIKPGARIVGIASTPDGKGYWLVGADGGVFAFGDATYLGSLAGKHLAAPIAGITATTGDPLPQCTGIELTATTDKSSYSEGQPVIITLTYRNPTATACSANVGSATAGCSNAFVYAPTGQGPLGPEIWDALSTGRAKSRHVLRGSTNGPSRRTRPLQPSSPGTNKGVPPGHHPAAPRSRCRSGTTSRGVPGVSTTTARMSPPSPSRAPDVPSHDKQTTQRFPGDQDALTQAR
jgi:hypothetical protein